MRIRGLGCWMSLAGLASTLALACQMLPGENAEGEGPGDPRDRGEDQYGPGGPGPNYPGPGPDPNRPGPGGPGGPGGTPVVRKLALDLKGLAGFAILDDEGEDKSLSGVSLSSGAAASSASPQAGSAMWLSSGASGQVLARSRTLDASGARETILGRSAMGQLQAPNPTRGWAAQEDTSGADAPAPGGAAPPEPGPETGDDGVDVSAGEQAGLMKITEEGEIVPALVSLEEEPVETPPPSTGADAGAPEPAGPDGTGEDPAGAGGAPGGDVPSPGPQYYEPLPRVTAVGLSPDGNVYILFEYAFMYRQPSPEELLDGADLFAPGSPYRCQLFRASGNWQDAAANLAELECVTSDYDIRTWDARRVMQFDANGGLYFRAAIPGQPQEVFYHYDPVTRALKEKVNGNICWRDVQVTPRGSLFYTGISGSNGDCNGTSFFRYVSSDNRLTEIARDWWNFMYLAEQDPEDPNNERIIFYGPDPNATGGYSWDSACLYRYNPAIEDTAARTEKLVECSNNPWGYVYGENGPGTTAAEDLPGLGERCRSEGLFIGGEGVQGLSQLKDGTLFVVGTFQQKIPGEVHCGLDAQADHCDSLDPAHATEDACENAGHEWVHMQDYCSDPAYDNEGDCEINSATWHFGIGYKHYDAVGDACTVPRAGFSTWAECRTPGQTQSSGPTFTKPVTGLAYVVPTDGISELRLLSDPAEKVERYWAIEGATGTELYYSVYSAGQYNLRMAQVVDDGEGGTTIERRLVLEDHEVYNMQRDPGNPNRVLFDALQFSTNQYLFGSADTSLPTPEEVQASVETVSGVSGRVETLIVLPNF